MRTIASSIAGRFTNKQYSDWYSNAPLSVPYFDQLLLPVMLEDYEPEEDAEFIKDADKALRVFCALTSARRLKDSYLVYQEFQNSMDYNGTDHLSSELTELEDELEIWKYLKAEDLVLRRDDEGNIIIYVIGICDWAEGRRLHLLFDHESRLIEINGETISEYDREKALEAEEIRSAEQQKKASASNKKVPVIEPSLTITPDMKTVTSPVMGTFIQHEEFQDWWDSHTPIVIPYFDQAPLSIVLHYYIPEEDPNFLEDADKAFHAFLQLKPADREKDSYFVYKNLVDFRVMVGKNDVSKKLRHLKNEQRIWEFVEAGSIFVKRGYGEDRNIYLIVSCECEWEQEHGLDLVFNQGVRLTGVYNGLEAEDNITADDRKEAEQRLLTKTNPEETSLSSKTKTIPEAQPVKGSWWQKLFGLKG